ncbi:hypothetical protein ACF09H_32035 [Streptomyces sp. NPDC014983]|uniref:hypothetical protein n=1 Tax=Streptomyces sp. NPDC014983 TaxID=3364933 RepID=UPI0036F56B9C
MPSTRWTTTDLHQALHGLLDTDPLRADDGHPEFRLFVYHGRPARLNAQLLARFGAGLSQLKSLEAALDSSAHDWEHVKHPLRRRFTPLAWTCLSHLGGGEVAGAWANSHRLAFGPAARRPLMGDEFERSVDRRRRPWLYDPAEFQPDDSPGPHRGCTEYDVPQPARRGLL